MDPIENIFELGTNYGKVSSNQQQDLSQAEVVAQDPQENYEAFSIINELNNIEQGELFSKGSQSKVHNKLLSHQVLH